MNPSARFLSPADAARRLGVSAKALRLYEQRGLLVPGRTPAGWRAYGPAEMARGGEIAALRRLGLSLAEVGAVLAGDPQGLEPALAAHQATLEARARQLGEAIDRVRGLRAGLAAGHAPAAGDIAGLLAAPAAPDVAFDLPWPWGGERFELTDIRPITYIVGPLGSGKTRLARRIAETLPGADFLPMERDVAEGLAALEADGPGALVVDMVEEGLDAEAQEALIVRLRRRGPGARPLFLMTRSTSILDLAAVGPDEAILLCPANHSPPTRVDPWPGAPGYEAVATCLAASDVRARTAGLVAVRPQVA